MADNIDIDNILEDDMINALEGLDNFQPPEQQPLQEDVVQSDFVFNDDNIAQEELERETVEETSVEDSQVISIDSSNIGEITQLFKELLNNKTLEITIRLKSN